MPSSDSPTFLREFFLRIDDTPVVGMPKRARCKALQDPAKLPAGPGILKEDEFFERQLEKVRGIRRSERKFYQKITGIYATVLDYDPSATATKRFLAAIPSGKRFKRVAFPDGCAAGWHA